MATQPEWPFTENHSLPGRRKKAVRIPWDKERKDRLTALWLADERVEVIADEFEISPAAIYQKVHKLGLPPRRRSKRDNPAFPNRDTTGQRRFTGVEPGDRALVDLKPWHPALRVGTTIYGRLVEPAVMAKRLLRSGEHNRKIGSLAERGPWKGMPIFTLTLIERETCPSTCLEWATCYGNNMGKAPRILVDRWFMPRLQIELAHLDALHPNGFIVRLHVLGDFFSTEYVDFWRKALAEYPSLRIFGFTARQPGDPDGIGRAVLEMMAANLGRVAMRVSGYSGRFHGSEVVDKREDAIGVFCPAETDVRVCCANCMICVRSERTISFKRH